MKSYPGGGFRGLSRALSSDRLQLCLRRPDRPRDAHANHLTQRSDLGAM